MIGKTGRLFLAGLIVVGWSAMALSQGPLTGKKKLRALEVAKKDAQRQLLEQVKGLMITAETRVQDFMLEADIVTSQAEGFIRGARVVSERDLGDGTMEVVMEVTIAEVVTNVREVMKGVYKDGNFHGVNIDQVDVRTEKTVLRATGKGTGDQPAYMDPTAGVTTGGGGSVAYTPVAIPPAWLRVPPAKRLGAERAAKVIALRNLLERVKGLYINSETRVNDFVLESDRIEASLRGFLQGVEQVGSTRWLPDMTVEVKMRIPIETLDMQLKKILKGVWHDGQFKGVDFEKIHIKYGQKFVEEIGRATVDETGTIKEVDIDINVETRTPAGTGEGTVVIDKTTVVE